MYVNWNVIAQEPEKQTNKGCKGCKYLDRKWHCLYILRTKTMRNAKLGPNGCDKKEKPEKKELYNVDFLLSSFQIGKIMKARNGHIDDDNETAISMYDKGAVDLQIATVLGVSKQSVARWRKRTGRISNWDKRKDR